MDTALIKSERTLSFMSVSNHLLVAKELFKYNNPTVVRLIQDARRVLHRSHTANENEALPFWSVFLIYKCTTDCPYCVQNYSFKNDRTDSPLKGSLPPESWLRLNDLPNKPEGLVVTGGEPFLYKKLADVLLGLTEFKQIQVVTNLNIDPSIVVERLSKVTTPKVSFECSYHEESIEFGTFLTRAIMIKKAGMLGSVRVIDIDPSRTKRYIKDFALHGIKIHSLDQIGVDGDEVLVLGNLEASNLVRKPPVLCKTKLTLFAPNGDVYNCHTKLYWADKAASFGNVTTGFNIPEDYLSCSDYGFCQPCQIGYMDVKTDIPKEAVAAGLRILPSNPPPTVVQSR
jgi:organic radical activating enzyme